MSFNARPNKYLHPSELYKFKSLVMTMIKRVKCFFKEYLFGKRPNKYSFYNEGSSPRII